MNKSNTIINILLADDDLDDCLIFTDAIKELQLPLQLTIVNDCEKLMQYLSSTAILPQVVFLDLNMPRKNGFECLTEIKNHLTFKNVPVIIYSTSYNEEQANLLYKIGANYYICKPADFGELIRVIHKAIMLLSQNNLQATKENFYINSLKATL